MKNDLRKIEVLGVGITKGSTGEILEYLDELLIKNTQKGYVVTPNPEMIVLSQKDKTFRQILNQASISLADGAGLLVASKLLGKGLTKRFTGTDFVSEVSSRYAKKPVKLGFLGGGPRIAEKTAECLLKKYPGLTVSYVSDEWTRQGFANGTLLMKKIREKQDLAVPSRGSAENEHIDILFVAFGFPKQEYFMAENLPNLPVTLAVGVGGAFDYISGNVKRAPRLMRAVGLEWLFRLIRQPWRIKRQSALVQFIYIVLKERFFRKQNRLIVKKAT